MNSCITLTFCGAVKIIAEQGGNIALSGIHRKYTQVIEYLQTNNYPQENIEKYNLSDYSRCQLSRKNSRTYSYRNLISEHQELYNDLINIVGS